MRKTIMLVGALFAVGCGVSDADVYEVDGETAEELGELGTSTKSYVVLRRDTRRCVSPMCGGYWAHDVNRATLREVYVNGLDFSASGLLDEVQGQVTGAPDFEVVLYGKLGPAEARFDTRPFLVTSAWRGLPGVKFSDTADTFYKVADANIRCITAPCPSLRATKLHTTQKTLFHDLDLSGAATERLDQDWLMDRVVNGGALVAGALVTDAQARLKRLDASQVFVKLPDVVRSCPRYALARCPAGQVNVFTRNSDRCTVPAGCATAGFCAAYVPSCATGYSLVSWTGGVNACQQYACDPEFLFP